MKLGILSLVLFSVTAFAAPQNLTVKVEGMVCQFCAQGITKKFKAEKAVETVHVDMQKKEVHLALKDGQTLDDARITTLIKDSGVNVKEILR